MTVSWTGELTGREMSLPSVRPTRGSGDFSKVSGILDRLGINFGGGAGAAPGAPGFQWQFPQYSESWAFTPPTPSKYTPPPAFTGGTSSLFNRSGRRTGTSRTSGTSGTPRTGGFLGNMGGAADLSTILQRFQQPQGGMTLRDLMAKYYSR